MSNQAVQLEAAEEGMPMNAKAALACLPYSRQQINGFWHKDRKRSDRMAAVFDIMGKNQPAGVELLVKGTYIRLTIETFQASVVTILPGIRIPERFPLSGDVVRNERRDMRRGGSWGRVELTHEGVVVHSQWKAPFAGSAREIFKLVNPHELHTVTEMWVGEQMCKSTQVFTRQDDQGDEAHHHSLHDE